MELQSRIAPGPNLSWKLACVLRGQLPARMLDTYDLERRDAAREMVDMAVMLGDQIQPTDPEAAAERDAMFEEINRDPAAAEAFSRDVGAPLLDVRMNQGWLGDDECAGRMLPQPDVAGQRLDNFLGQGFVALLPDQGKLPMQISGHPLWQALTPVVHEYPRALSDFVDLQPGEICYSEHREQPGNR